MEQFASGWKRNYYGKGDVIVYRLNRDGSVPAGASPVFGANVLMLALRRRVLADLHDRRQHRPRRHRLDEELHPARDAELRRQRPRRRTAASSRRRSWRSIRRSKAFRCRPTRSRTPASPGGPAFTPAGPERAQARVELTAPDGVVEAVVRPPRLQAAAPGRQRVPGLRARRVHDAAGHRRIGRCTCGSTSNGATPIRPRRSTAARRRAARAQIVHETFDAFESGSIQQVIYQIGTAMLADIPRIARGAPRGEQPHVGYDCRARRRRSASTPMRGRRTGAWG